jgi:hypothetical protein
VDVSLCRDMLLSAKKWGQIIIYLSPRMSINVYGVENYFIINSTRLFLLRFSLFVLGAIGFS